MDRVYSPEDGETDVTPRDITDLSLEEQVEFITLWFLAMFEDPQNETPYAEKGSPHNYNYVWGGPYDAADEIGDNFAGLASDDAIEAAVREVEKEGIIEWAPGRQHPDHRPPEDEEPEEADPPPPSLDEIRRRLDGGIQPRFDDPLQAQARAALRSEIAELRELLAQHAPRHRGIGDNNPPDAIGLSIELTMDISIAIGQIDDELVKEAPNANTVVESTSVLDSALASARRKLDRFGDAFTDGLGDQLGRNTAVLIGVASYPVLEKIVQLVQAALHWLDVITLPF